MLSWERNYWPIRLQKSAALSGSQVILMENHGIVCLGKDLLTAFDRMEVLEFAAKMTLVTGFIGNSHALSQEQMREIDKLVGN
jgi:L-fuculose-phosphate aldolase